MFEKQMYIDFTNSQTYKLLRLANLQTYKLTKFVNLPEIRMYDIYKVCKFVSL